jgi:hypothetical protein
LCGCAVTSGTAETSIKGAAAAAPFVSSTRMATIVAASAYNLQELNAAMQRTLALVNSNPAFGTLAVLVDKRRNGIVVDSVTLVSGGNGGCRNRPPLPSHDPVNGVPIFDERDC